MSALSNDLTLFEYDLSILRFRDAARSTLEETRSINDEWERTGVRDQLRFNAICLRSNIIKSKAFETLFEIFRFGQENPGVKSKTNCLIGQILSVTKEVENQERELLKKHPATVQRTKWLDLRLPDENPYFEIGIWTGKPSAIQWREEDLSEERHWIVSDPGPQSYTAWALEKINLKKIAAAALFGMAALRYVIR